MNIEALTDFLLKVLQAGTSVIVIATMIVKLTPTKKDDAILAKIIKFIKYVSLYKD